MNSSTTTIGFSSSSFNLAENAGDSRLGMDERSLTEVRRIMEELGCSFDDGKFSIFTSL